MYDLSGVKTLDVFFYSAKYEDYEVVHEDGHIYIAGTGKPLFSNTGCKTDAAVMSYEYIKSISKRFDDAVFLEKMLTYAHFFMTEKRNNRAFNEESDIPVALNFCREWGLPNIDFSNNPRTWFDVQKFANKMKWLGLIYDDLIKIQETECEEEKKMIISRLGLQWNIDVKIQPLYSTDKKNVQSALIANSLVDVALYQLCEVISNNGTVKKCANPSCGNYIVGGRRNKRTCSDACRQAVSRAARNKERKEK